MGKVDGDEAEGVCFVDLVQVEVAVGHVNQEVVANRIAEVVGGVEDIILGKFFELQEP